ncbi:uncharacterized protein N7482_002436 [Penicillium canariense]|uniref:Uncharacterized protein n=1 Tax=Penicillium canariense TaxID=189055 RepID=A0A9W9IFC5_9EURO|nr:uncharacterized protein N7482_002436 [Penicillium canariense]KAJ5176559.1 hypothetical protein N7482_002436 [Penicillium canariense]
MFPLGIAPTFPLCSLASSTWRLLGDSGCDAEVKKETTRHTWVQIGTGRPTPYSFCGNIFSYWIGTTTEKATGPNYLGILAIGWCYILSAELVAKQGGSAVMRYTDSRADILGEGPYNPSEEVHFIDVGEVDERTARWWSAILAKREGWQAIVKGKYIAPWSVSRTCETPFIIKRRRNSLLRDSLPLVQTPLSSDDAFDALLEFASLHNLGSQFPIALTTAMSFTMHTYFGTDVKLPLPRAHGGQTPTTTLGASPMWTELKKELPYYMTLSCTPDVMISTLCGSFWQPDIPCNMVSQWLHPVLEEVLCDVAEGKGQELLALIGAIRRPSVGALWIGAAMSGIGPEILKWVRRGRPPLDSNAFPWTGAPQHFMDDAGSGPYTWGDPEYISRPDVWRLLPLTPTDADDDLGYEYQPTTPWEPCGACSTTNCALRVMSHSNCARHAYRYDHFNWELENGETVQDFGFSERYPSLLTELSIIPDSKVISHSFERKELDPDREASEEASLEIFRWFVIGGEGIPPEKIFRDDLLQQSWDQLDDHVGYGEADPPDSEEPVLKNKDRLEAWLDTIG